MEKLVQERELRAKAEAAATEAERQRQVVALDLKDAGQKMDRLKQEYNALVDKVNHICDSILYILQLHHQVMISTHILALISIQ